MASAANIDQGIARLVRLEVGLAALRDAAGLPLAGVDIAVLAAAMRLLRAGSGEFERALGLQPGWRSKARAVAVREKLRAITTTARSGRARQREIAALLIRHPNRIDVRAAILANGGKVPSETTIRRAIKDLPGSRAPLPLNQTAVHQHRESH